MNHKSRATRPRGDLTAINSLEHMSRYASAHHQPVVVVPGDSLTNGNRGCANSIAMAHWCQKIQPGNQVSRSNFA